MSLLAKINRRIARRTDRAVLPKLQETIISFSFDDCPKSAITNALPMLEAEGWRATIYVACGLCDTTNHLGLHMSESDIIETHQQGHEIADHTFSHLSADTVTLSDYIADIERNQHTLNKLGLPRSRHFAYPYGHLSPALKKGLQNHFKTLRGVVAPASSAQDANLMNAIRVYSNDSIEHALDQISKAKNAPKWLHLFTHDVQDNPSEFGCTEDDFRKIISAVKANAFRVMTVDDAYRTITKRGQMS